MKPLILKTARKAGAVLLKHYGKIVFSRTKEMRSYYTNADLESERLIISSIRRKFPGHNIVSEEAGAINNKSDYTWYIDPLDGTHNYMRKIPLYGVSIALALKGDVKYGAIYLPYFDELYFAEKGKRAFLNGRRIKVSNKKLEEAFVLSELVFRRRAAKISALSKIKKFAYDVRLFGSASFGLAQVAKGSADAYVIFDTKPWDIAAGFLIIEEAGGKAADFNGKRWKPESNGYVASNSLLHKDLLAKLK